MKLRFTGGVRKDVAVRWRTAALAITGAAGLVLATAGTAAAAEEDRLSEFPGITTTSYHREMHPAGGYCLTGTAQNELKNLPCGQVSGGLADHNQQWAWVPTSSGFVQLKNRQHGTCVSVSVGTGGYEPDLQACNATHNRQQWTRTGDSEWKNRWQPACLGWTAGDRFGLYHCGADLNITMWVDRVVATV